MIQVANWQTSAPAIQACDKSGCLLSGYSGAVVSWLELPICAAFLALGVVITRILAGPAQGCDVSDTSSLSSRKASFWPPSAGDLEP